MNNSKRKIRGNYLPVLFILAAFITLSAGPVLAGDQMIARLTNFSGQIMIKSNGHWGTEPRENLPLFSEDKVVTRAGRATITFLDGAVMEMRPNSNLLIQETEEEDPSTKTKIIKRKLRLLLGKLLFRTGRIKNSTVLQTPTAVCGLRGTEGVLSIDAGGQPYIFFTEGETSYTIGDFIAGVAQDVPAELADLNPVQRAAFVAAAAEQTAQNAAAQVESGEITDTQAALAQAEAAEAAAQEAKAAAEAMLSNPDPTVQSEASDAVTAAESAIKAAQDAKQKVQGALQSKTESGSPTPLTEANGDTGTGGDDQQVNQTPTFDVPSPLDIPPTPEIGDPPALAVTTSPDRYTNLAEALFEFTVDQDATVSYSLDGSSPVSVPTFESDIYSINLPGLSEGDHQIVITATNADGKTSTLSQVWTNDFTNPVVQLAAKPDAVANTDDFQFQSQDITPITTYKYSLDNGETWLDSGSSLDLNLQTDGNMQILVLAVDSAGNTTDVSQAASYSWEYDNTNPVFTVAQAPLGTSTNTSDFSFDFQAEDAHDLIYAYSLDGGSNWTVTGDTFTPPAFSDGATSLKVKATDAAGNETISESSWITDNTPPSFTVEQAPVEVPTNTNNFSFDFQAEDATALTYAYSLDAGETWIDTGDTFSPPQVFDDGPSSLKVKVTDEAGNETISESSWFTDNTPPAFIAEQAPEGTPTNTDLFAFDFQASDETGLTYAYSLDGGETWTDTGDTFTLPAFSDGATSLKVRATDEAGNETISSDYSWTTDNTPPANLAMQNPSVSPEVINFTLAGEDASNVTYNWILKDSGDVPVPEALGTTDIDGLVSIPDLNTLDLSEGTYRLGYTAVDEAGNETAAENDIIFYLTKYTLAGSAAEYGSYSGTGNAAGNISIVNTPDWGGGWTDTLTGPSNLSGPWQAVAGGEMSNSIGLNGYWLENINGSDSAGISSLTYLTGLALGQGTGTATTIFDGYTWTASDSGTLTETPLTFGSDFSGTDGTKNGYLRNLFAGTHYGHDFERYATDGYNSYPDGDNNDYSYEYFVADHYDVPDSADYVFLFAEIDDNSINDSTTALYSPFSASYDKGTLIHVRSPWKGAFFVNGAEQWDIGSLTADSFPTISELPASPGTWWERNHYEESRTTVLADSGTFSGMLGGTGDLWSPDTPISLIGQFIPWDGDYSRPSLFNANILSSDVTINNTGGAYHGRVGGVIHDNNVIGRFRAIYIKDDGSAGILDGPFGGSSYPDIGMWEAAGSVTAMQMTADTGLTPGELEANLEYKSMPLIGWAGGNFLDGATPDLSSSLHSEMGFGSTYSLTGHDDWGIYGFAFGGDDYFDNPGESTAWTARVGGFGLFGRVNGLEYADQGYFLSGQISGTAVNGLLSAAPFSGKILTLAKYVDSPNVTGNFIGTYDDDQTWQGNMGGYWQNAQTLSFNGTFHGDLTLTRKGFQGYGQDGQFGDAGYRRYDYDYDEVTNSAWVYDEDASGNGGAGIKTQRSYNPDGTYKEWSEDYEGGSLTYNDDGTWSGDLLNDILIPKTETYYSNTGNEYSLDWWLDDTDEFTGYLGGLEDLWTATLTEPADLVMQGEYRADSRRIAPGGVFSTDILPRNPYDYSNTIWDKDHSTIGAYYGYLGGRTLQGSDPGNPLPLIDGSLLALYLDDSGNAGILKGDFEGLAYPDARMFEATGSVFPIQLVTGTVLQAETFVNTLTGSETRDESQADFYGEFYDGGQIYAGEIGCLYYKSSKVGLTGVTGDTPWVIGVRSSLYGGDYYTYGAGTFDTWEMTYYDDTPDLLRMGFISSLDTDTPSKFSDGEISSKGYGAWASWSSAMTGVNGIDLKGTFDPNSQTWQASAMSAYMDTNTFLTLAADANGGQTKLAQLNIPYINIGETSLSGTNQNMTVNINNVKFFAYSNNAAPKIWATNNVSGSYNTLLPQQYDTVLLQSAPGTNAVFNNATFQVQNFTQPDQSGNGQWGATIYGSGSVTNVHNSQLYNVYLDGAAAGKYTGSQTSGNFTGNASGVAQPGIN